MVYPNITAFIESLPDPQLSEERAGKWQTLASRLLENDKSGAVDFICTHNARRSALSQSLASAIAHHLSLHHLVFWSGGAEVTATHPNTIKTLVHIGFRLAKKEREDNPVYSMSYADDANTIDLFSKRFDDTSTPAPYHAVLVCSSSDKACPFIPGVTSRTLIPFKDPGYADGTENADSAYMESAIEIASEILYFLKQLCPPHQD